MAYAPYRNRKTGKLSLRYVAPMRGKVAPRKKVGQWGRRLINDGAYHVTKGFRL